MAAMVGIAMPARLPLLCGKPNVELSPFIILALKAFWPSDDWNDEIDGADNGDRGACWGLDEVCGLCTNEARYAASAFKYSCNKQKP